MNKKIMSIFIVLVIIIIFLFIFVSINKQEKDIKKIDEIVLSRTYIESDCKLYVKYNNEEIEGKLFEIDNNNKKYYFEVSLPENYVISNGLNVITNNCNDEYENIIVLDSETLNFQTDYLGNLTFTNDISIKVNVQENSFINILSTNDDAVINFPNDFIVNGVDKENKLNINIINNKNGEINIGNMIINNSYVSFNNVNEEISHFALDSSSGEPGSGYGAGNSSGSENSSSEFHVKMDSLVVEGKSKIEIKGTDGEKGSPLPNYKDGTDGKSVSLKINKYIVNMGELDILLKGGNGGEGIKGRDGRSRYSGGCKLASDGTHGGNGGDVNFEVDNIINKGELNIELISGIGGNGGNGGRKGRGCDRSDSAVSGGNGGNAGNVFISGYSGFSTNEDSNESIVEDANLSYDGSACSLVGLYDEKYAGQIDCSEERFERYCKDNNLIGMGHPADSNVSEDVNGEVSDDSNKAIDFAINMKAINLIYNEESASFNLTANAGRGGDGGESRYHPGDGHSRANKDGDGGHGGAISFLNVNNVINKSNSFNIELISGKAGKKWGTHFNLPNPEPKDGVVGSLGQININTLFNGVQEGMSITSIQGKGEGEISSGSVSNIDGHTDGEFILK